jgi:hypothetical protein
VERGGDSTPVLAAGCRRCGRRACQGLFCLGYICILARPSRHPSLSLSSRGALPSTDMPRTDQDPELRFAVQTRGCDQQRAPCASSASRRGTWLAPGGGYSSTMHAYSVLCGCTRIELRIVSPVNGKPFLHGRDNCERYACSVSMHACVHLCVRSLTREPTRARIASISLMSVLLFCWLLCLFCCFCFFKRLSIFWRGDIRNIKKT